MRLLLLNVRGATSFENLRTVNSITHLSFQSCAIFLGLLENDKAYNDTLNEAASVTTDSNKLRLLFSMILAYGQPSNPGELWENHKSNLCEDNLYKERIRLNNSKLPLSQGMIHLGLYYINDIIYLHIIKI